MSEYTFATGDDEIVGRLHKGPTWVTIDAFTPNEHWVPLDSDEARQYLAAQPAAPASTLVVKGIDYKKKVVTLEPK